MLDFLMQIHPILLCYIKTSNIICFLTQKLPPPKNWSQFLTQKLAEPKNWSHFLTQKLAAPKIWAHFLTQKLAAPKIWLHFLTQEFFDSSRTSPNTGRLFRISFQHRHLSNNLDVYGFQQQKILSFIIHILLILFASKCCISIDLIQSDCCFVTNVL